MSTRTKSFFDADQRKPRPGQWSRRPHAHPARDETSANPPPPPKPPIPAATQAKSKLQAFQFAPNEAESTKQTDETSQVDAAPDRTEQAAASNGNAAEPASTKPAPTLPHANTFPSTPGARLPLEDLIGDCDRSQREEPVHYSPEEQIGWIPNSSALTPNRRKRKRAKSSSPSCPTTSSQQDKTSAFFGDGGVPSTAKKTPITDPTADLWQRYANSKQAGEGLKPPEVSSLMLTGSPRPVETPIRSGPFRRWASTGNDWPSTKNKRRCTAGGQRISVWQDQTAIESGGKSKVASMVQSIQDNLASQKLEQETKAAKPVAADGPSSSSPLPETGAENFPAPGVVSPLQTRQPNVRSPAKVQARAPEPKARLPSQGIRPTQSGGFRADPSKPVGDPLNPSTTGLYLHSKAPLPAYKRPSINRLPSQPRVQQVRAPPVVAPPSKDFDEFGDDAFDLTADDLDELLSQKPLEQRSLYDIPQHPNPTSKPPTGNKTQHTKLRAAPETITIDDDDDEFGGDNIDEDSFAQAELSATQAHRISPRKRSPRKGQSPRKSASQHTQQHESRLQRYMVKQVVDGEYTNDKGRRLPEKVIVAEHWRTSRTTAITLRGSWTATAVCKGNPIHVARLRRDASPLETPSGQVMITDDEGSPFIIVHPDHMLSATTVADSFDCIRKAVLQDRIKATGETSKAMVYGSVLHEIFQQALSANQWDEQFLANLVERTLKAHVEGLWELGMRDINLAAEEVKAKIGELAAWARVFVLEQPGSDSLVDDRQGEKVWMSISKLIAIEEHIWSPQFGLKGNIDATVQTALVDDPRKPAKRLIVPIEVKTGKTTQSAAHRAQTALYTLLLSDRYDVAVEAGILYYLESSSMSRIAPPLVEVRQMVQQRNRLAAYIFRARNPPQAVQDEDTKMIDVGEVQSQEVEESGLPNLLRNPFKCGRCYAQQSCFKYHALVENGTADTAGMIDDQKKNHSLVWHEAVGHLLGLATSPTQTDTLKRWFTKWEKLLTFEESGQSRMKRELWTMSSVEREALGRCFGNLILMQDLTNTASVATTQTVDGVEGGGGKINRYAYVFARATSAPGTSFAEGSQLTVGEPVVVSSESGQWALANGYVVGVSRHSITVAVDRKLGDSRQRLAQFDDKANQAFKGTMTVGEEGTTQMSHEPVLYRLDKDEFSNGLALVRNNLVSLMSSAPIETKLREQIIFGVSPTFQSTASATSNQQPTQLGEMNEDQQSAVSKVLAAQDYALILGMPGTGKTTTIAHIIRALLAENKSILLTSFTHTAVDNILLKIRDIAPQGCILRLGVPAKINSQVQEFCQLAATPHKTIDEIDAAYMETKIVATTCMGTKHALFNRRSFDVCIVDEASQITLPTILGPLLHARRFVLVGDHFQLPPLVQNKAALEGGLDVSLFRQLSEEQPGAVAALGRQYRMCEDIMTLSNELIYHGQLRCGDEAVASRTLQMAEPHGLARFHRAATQLGCLDNDACWLAQATNPARKVIYANTDGLGQTARETLTTGARNITNQAEATLSAQLVLSFLAKGVPASEIGVITLYRSQLALMRQVYKKAGIPSEVEIDSADRFQGRDKECIILSMVRSNEAGIVGDLLKDWRRVNVALTRARSKLVVLGSRSTLQNNELLAKFLSLVDSEGWTLELPEHADEMHTFHFSTQITQEILAQSPGLKRKRESPAQRRSPMKKAKTSPLKLSQGSPSKRMPLQLSQSAGNRSSAKTSSQAKKSQRRITGSRVTGKMRQAKEQIAIEIFEDLTGEEF